MLTPYTILDRCLCPTHLTGALSGKSPSTAVCISNWTDVNQISLKGIKSCLNRNKSRLENTARARYLPLSGKIPSRRMTAREPSRTSRFSAATKTPNPASGRTLTRTHLRLSEICWPLFCRPSSRVLPKKQTTSPSDQGSFSPRKPVSTGGLSSYRPVAVVSRQIALASARKWPPPASFSCLAHPCF